jgi:1-acyl-sn-glycerol-3-phosphate acyltransferase
MKKKLYSFLFFKVFGWNFKGTFDREIKKCVFIVYPHTSWYDFFLGVAMRCVLDLKIDFVAKKELFVFPLNFYFTWMGGAPLNRGKNENKVDSIAKIFETKEIFRLSLSPEGTRKKVAAWKTGFYYIAQKANVPIVCVGFDYKTKQIVIGQPLKPSGNYEADLKILENDFKGIEGKFPEKSTIF